jgi:uncharacterized protein YktB (UPF0637 family)
MLRRTLLWISRLTLSAALISSTLIRPLSAQVPVVNGVTFAGIADWDGDGHKDIVAKDSTGVLWLYPGESKRGYSQQSRFQIGHGWNGFTFAGIADWDGDGHQDIVAKDPTGVLWLYPGESKRGYSQQSRVQIGHGWNGFTFAGIADWDGDGHQDIVAKDPTGVLWLYAGESKRDYSQQSRVQIGHGWNGFTFAGIADWDGDGHQDIVAKDPTSVLWLYAGESKRGYSQQSRVQIGHGWNGFTFADIADWDGDGHQDIVAKDPTSVLWLYAGESKRDYSQQSRVQIGHGW